MLLDFQPFFYRVVAPGAPGCIGFTRSGQRLIMISRNDEHRPLARFGATVAMAPDCSAAPAQQDDLGKGRGGRFFEVEKTHGFSKVFHTCQLFCDIFSW